MRKILSLLLVLLSLFASAQKKATPKPIKATTEPAVIECDCKNAVAININKVTTYGLTIPTSGFGTVQEITSKNKGDKYNFEQEHNSAWYLLSINFDGEFVFEITPKDSSNDYDFLLYKYTDTSFCDALQQKQIKPVRSNLSRDNAQIRGLTGLSTTAQNEFVGPGVGQSWSKSIQVVKGDKYVLVLDNVYPEGEGHILKFNYIKQVTIAGTVVGSDSLPMKAEVLLSDNEGNTVEQITTGKDGKYSIATGLKDGLNYTVVLSSDSSFIATRTINTKTLKAGVSTFTDIRTVLPRLKKGAKYRINSINFVGNASTLLSESYPTVEALYRLMKKNKKMKIRVEGHINGPGTESNAWNQQLSELRAQTVQNYLVEKGIEKERITTIGFSNKKMLFQRPKNEFEASSNRRVEINVLSIE